MSTPLNCSSHDVPTTEDFTKAQIATIFLDLVVCVEYIATVALIIFLGTYQRFLARLLLYLIVVILFFTISDAIKMAAFQESDAHGTLQLRESVCTATAFFQQFSLWLLLFILCGMAFYIFSLAVCQRNDVHTRRCEIIAIAAALAVALLFSVIPFIPIEGSTAYGWSEGFTCWIRTINITSCEPFTPGRVEQFLLWYIWCGIAFTFITVSLTFSIRALYRQFCMESGFSRKIQYRQALKEAVALLVYIVIFIVLILVEFIAHLIVVYSSSRTNAWVLDAIFDPLLFLLIPAAFILHPATLKIVRCSELRNAAKKWKRRLHLDVDTIDSETNCIVPNESEFESSGDQEHRLIITGTRYTPNYATLETVRNPQMPMAP